MVFIAQDQDRHLLGRCRDRAQQPGQAGNIASRVQVRHHETDRSAGDPLRGLFVIFDNFKLQSLNSRNDLLYDAS